MGFVLSLLSLLLLVVFASAVIAGLLLLGAQVLGWLSTVTSSFRRYRAVFDHPESESAFQAGRLSAELDLHALSAHQQLRELRNRRR